jgi:GH15 family glucan-1,4-alpha-glucosidase
VLTGREADAGRLFGRLLGNVPQAFSHIALVNTAHNLGRPSKPAEQRAGQAEPGT